CAAIFGLVRVDYW
nr:immunoglobulin heavy chain junction region [Macaca mulatta]MOV37897.1 immunoglobulin heavy chain junction region [Macaca mulatta]MOV39507.1 immunoglobulin heavy chain junction region [Macaca mulatta]MOV42558.1 immunoglobulin heavy chain junction region [Macaca mulatta]MOV43152.1 immunoglobulin heavy chain junction region [Macaca mulatta]